MLKNTVYIISTLVQKNMYPQTNHKVFVHALDGNNSNEYFAETMCCCTTVTTQVLKLAKTTK
jgi:hypothetical protein